MRASLLDVFEILDEGVSGVGEATATVFLDAPIDDLTCLAKE